MKAKIVEGFKGKKNQKRKEKMDRGKGGEIVDKNKRP